MLEEMLVGSVLRQVLLLGLSAFKFPRVSSGYRHSRESLKSTRSSQSMYERPHCVDWQLYVEKVALHARQKTTNFGKPPFQSFPSSVPFSDASAQYWVNLARSSSMIIPMSLILTFYSTQKNS